MNETCRKIVNFIASNFLLVLIGGTAVGVFYGIVTSLIDGNFFVEVLVIDGIVGFIASLFTGLISVYLRFRLGASGSPVSQKSNAQPLSADESKLRDKLEKTIKARKYTMLVMPIVAMSTVLQYVGVFAPGNLPPWFGIVVLLLCGVQIPFLSHRISKIEASISNRIS